MRFISEKVPKHLLAMIAKTLPTWCDFYVGKMVEKRTGGKKCTGKHVFGNASFILWTVLICVFIGFQFH